MYSVIFSVEDGLKSVEFKETGMSWNKLYLWLIDLIDYLIKCYKLLVTCGSKFFTFSQDMLSFHVPADNWLFDYYPRRGNRPSLQ